jgi:hypothetical protein
MAVKSREIASQNSFLIPTSQKVADPCVSRGAEIRRLNARSPLICTIPAKNRIAAAPYEISNNALGRSSAMAAPPGVSRSDAAPVGFASLAVGRSDTQRQAAQREAMRARQIIVFFRISSYNFCLSGIVPCPFALIPKTRCRRRAATPPASEADVAPPSPRKPLKRKKAAK